MNFKLLTKAALGLLICGGFMAHAFDDQTVNARDEAEFSEAMSKMEPMKRRAYEGMPCWGDGQCFKGADGLVCHRGYCTHRSRFRYCSRDRDCYRGYDNWRCWEHICRPNGSWD